MQALNLEQFAESTIVIVAPHMDDEALACGGLIARLPNKHRIHVIYATDGMKSPAPIFAGHDRVSPNLGKIRMKESAAAMQLLGVPEQNLHFLCLPEAELQKNIFQLQKQLRKKIEDISPNFVFIPFRYDRHLDHLAVNHVVVSAIKDGVLHMKWVEYFVYYRWRLMPQQDIRKYIKPQFLYTLDIASVANQKRQSLNCFTSQTTIYYPWMTRPILTPKLLDEECQNPECFLIAPPSSSETAVLSGPVLWIRLAHRLEPILLRWKYLTLSMLKRVFHKSVN